MSKGVTLLPEEMRDREKKAKKKVKSSMGLPKFKMHLPETKKKRKTKASSGGKGEAWIKMASNSSATQKQGADFKVVKKAPKKVTKKIVPKNNDIPALYGEMLKVDFWSKVRALIIIVLCFGIFFAVGWYVIEMYQSQLSKSDKETDQLISQTEAEINLFIADKNQAENQLEKTPALAFLLDDQVHWRSLFDALEKSLVSNVYYTNFSITVDDRLMISARATNFAEASDQLQKLQTVNFVESVEVISIAQVSMADNDEPHIVFDMLVKLRSDNLFE